MSAAKKRKPVTGDESFLRDLHKVFGGDLVLVDQRIDDVTITTEKHDDVADCVIVLDDGCAEGFNFQICPHFLDVRKAAYARWEEAEVAKGYKVKTPEVSNVIQLKPSLQPSPNDDDDGEPPVNPRKRPKAGVWYDDFYAVIPARQYVYMPTREMWPAGAVDAKLPPVKLKDKKTGRQIEIQPHRWLDKNKATEQMTWAPGLPMVIRHRLMANGGWIDEKGVACFNVYLPPTVQIGDATKAGPWIDHVRKVYPGEADHLFKWFAQRVQHPEIKVNHGLLLGGAMGIGKDTLLEPVKHAVGHWNFQEVSPIAIMGRFNSFAKCVILRVSEIRDLGEVDRYAFHDHMKTLLVTPPDVLRVDEKHMKEYYVPNCVGVILTTNYKTDGIYLTADDRRHYVAWSDCVKTDFGDTYWNELWGWYDKGGIGHVAAYLGTLDLSDFDPKAPPPKTEAFWAIVDANRAPEDAEMADLLESLGNPDAVTIHALQIKAVGEFDTWLLDRKNRRIIPHRLEQCGYVQVRNDAAKDGLWKIGGRRQVVYASSKLPTPERFKAAQGLC